MKSKIPMWVWLAGGVGAYYLYTKSQQSQMMPGAGLPPASLPALPPVSLTPLAVDPSKGNIPVKTPVSSYIDPAKGNIPVAILPVFTPPPINMNALPGVVIAPGNIPINTNDSLYQEELHRDYAKPQNQYGGYSGQNQYSGYPGQNQNQTPGQLQPGQYEYQNFI